MIIFTIPTAARRSINTLPEAKSKEADGLRAGWKGRIAGRAIRNWGRKYQVETVMITVTKLRRNTGKEKTMPASPAARARIHFR